MTSEAYELLALSARYFFTALMALIVLRAAKGALTDSRRAAKLRRLSPMTGLSGELLVLEGDQRARQGMRYPIIREGMIGTSRRADVRIRHSSIRRRHAYFQLTEEGLKIRSHAGARLRNARGKSIREAILQDNDAFTVGSVRLVLVLNVPSAPRRRPRPEREEEIPELFDVKEWDDRRYTDPDPVSPIFDRAERPQARPFDREELSPIFREDKWNEARMRRRQSERNREFERRGNALRTREDRRIPEENKNRRTAEIPRQTTDARQTDEENRRLTEIHSESAEIPRRPTGETENTRSAEESIFSAAPSFSPGLLDPDEHEPTLADDLAELFEAEDDWDEWCEPKEPPEGWDDTPDDYDPDSLFNTGSSRK